MKPILYTNFPVVFELSIYIYYIIYKSRLGFVKKLRENQKPSLLSVITTNY